MLGKYFIFICICMYKISLCSLFSISLFPRYAIIQKLNKKQKGSKQRSVEKQTQTELSYHLRKE